MPMPLAVLVSGGGSNLQSIIDRIEAGTLDAEIKLVVSNKADAYGLERAKRHGAATAVFVHTDYESREACDRAIVAAMREAGVGADGAVILAGFMRMVTSELLDAFPDRVLNIHPAILPSFPGLHGQGDAADYGVKIAGCTVHYVDELMDNGPIVIQAAVPCLAGESAETLGPRILKTEHRILPQAIQWLAEDRLRINGRHVELQPSDRPLAEQPLADVEPETRALIWPPLEEGF